MELEEIVTFMILMVVFSAMIVSINLNNTNLINKNPSHSIKLHMEDILIHSIKKLKTNLFIISVMEVEETFMSHLLKEEIVILINGEIKQDLSSEIV
jgi:hypothetical protein